MNDLRPAVGFAWRAYRRHAGLFAALLLAGLGAWVALEVAVIAGQRLGVAWWAAAHLVFLVVAAGVGAACLRAGLAIYDGGAPTWGAAFGPVRQWPGFLAGHLLYAALVAAGLPLLLAPGCWWAARYGLFGFSIVAQPAGLRRSFAHSAALTAGREAAFLGALLLLLLLNLLGASLLGLGLLFTLPFSVLTLTALYRQRRAAQPA